MYPFHNKASFYGEELLATRPTPKLEDHHLSAVHDCLFNLFTATLHIGGCSSVHNLRTHHKNFNKFNWSFNIRNNCCIKEKGQVLGVSTSAEISLQHLWHSKITNLIDKHHVLIFMEICKEEKQQCMWNCGLCQWSSIVCTQCKQHCHLILSFVIYLSLIPLCTIYSTEQGKIPFFFLQSILHSWNLQAFK